jgi:FAD/FMN-containing dehydrogenase
MHEEEINTIIYTQIKLYSGSISAEHGIGQLKRDYLQEHRGQTAYQMMTEIKRALDPHYLLNPHKVLK